jgi:cysteinyl-tRNA synthetase
MPEGERDPPARHDGAREARVRPADPKRITMYVCGPTVYGRAHIGNARPAVVFDTLARLIRHEFGADSLVYARNVTDVDDKIIAAAEEEGVDTVGDHRALRALLSRGHGRARRRAARHRAARDRRKSGR